MSAPRAPELGSSAASGPLPAPRATGGGGEPGPMSVRGGARRRARVGGGHRRVALLPLRANVRPAGPLLPR